MWRVYVDEKWDELDDDAAVFAGLREGRLVGTTPIKHATWKDAFFIDDIERFRQRQSEDAEATRVLSPDEQLPR